MNVFRRWTEKAPLFSLFVPTKWLTAERKLRIFSHSWPSVRSFVRSFVSLGTIRPRRSLTSWRRGQNNPICAELTHTYTYIRHTPSSRLFFFQRRPNVEQRALRRWEGERKRKQAHDLLLFFRNLKAHTRAVLVYKTFVLPLFGSLFPTFFFFSSSFLAQ